MMMTMDMTMKRKATSVVS